MAIRFYLFSKSDHPTIRDAPTKLFDAWIDNDRPGIFIDRRYIPANNSIDNGVYERHLSREFAVIGDLFLCYYFLLLCAVYILQKGMW